MSAGNHETLYIISRTYGTFTQTLYINQCIHYCKKVVLALNNIYYKAVVNKTLSYWNREIQVEKTNKGGGPNPEQCTDIKEIHRKCKCTNEKIKGLSDSLRRKQFCKPGKAFGLHFERDTSLFRDLAREGGTWGTLGHCRSRHGQEWKQGAN